jgi:hypothetical protein
MVADGFALAPEFNPDDPRFTIAALPPAPAKAKIRLPRLR